MTYIDYSKFEFAELSIFKKKLIFKQVAIVRDFALNFIIIP